MIGYLRGELLEKWERGCLILTPGGVGYTVGVSDMAGAGLPERGGGVSLYVHTIVREDALELYGFETFDDRCVFETLIGISKLGPKTALAILSLYTGDELRDIAVRGDMDALIRVPGIGKKSAQRIFVELKYKFEAEAKDAPAGVAGKSGAGGVYRDALAALGNLGYSDAEAAGVLKKTLEAEPDVDVSQALRLALKMLAAEKT